MGICHRVLTNKTTNKGASTPALTFHFVWRDVKEVIEGLSLWEVLVQRILQVRGSIVYSCVCNLLRRVQNTQWRGNAARER